MLATHWVEIPTAIALGIIAAILAISILASIIAMQMEKRKGVTAKQSNSGDK
jgi:hypothetical protein